ncbi:MAG: hypothetical protein KME13_26040 [Myxacorys californica WJT36-NPBG1]|jgi:hypothetical protein|nr:hypothetical protein [Myxacorys californica WJT36-NPBG1]
MSLTEFEQKLKELIENPTPQPQYQLWQTIRWKSYGLRTDAIEEKQGRIAGFYFISVGIAFQDASDPGWYYTKSLKSSYR